MPDLNAPRPCQQQFKVGCWLSRAQWEWDGVIRKRFYIVKLQQNARPLSGPRFLQKIASPNPLEPKFFIGKTPEVELTPVQICVFENGKKRYLTTQSSTSTTPSAATELRVDKNYANLLFLKTCTTRYARSKTFFLLKNGRGPIGFPPGPPASSYLRKKNSAFPVIVKPTVGVGKVRFANYSMPKKVR